MSAGAGFLQRLQRAALRWRSTRFVAVRPRLLFSILAATALFFCLPDAWRLTTRLLTVWNSGAVLYMALTVAMMIRDDHDRMRERARTQDEGRFVILAVAVLATLASLVAIVLQLAATKNASGEAKAVHVSLAALTIVTSWTFIHLMFALHYAHEYVSEWRRRTDRPDEIRGGLRFADTKRPVYTDFLYFSYVIGVASQTADVVICSRMMRTIALVHGVVAFFFNTTIVALTINIAAGLI